MLCVRPFAFADDRVAAAINDEMDGHIRRGNIKFDVEPLAAPKRRSVVRSFPINAHQREDRLQETLRLTKRQTEDSSKRQRSLDRVI